MPPEFEDFKDEVLDELRGELSDLWQDLNDSQKAVLQQTAKDLAHYALMYIKEPDKRASHTMTLLHLKGILESEAAFTQLRTLNRVKAVIGRVADRALTAVLATL